jgi:hypothetical protein
MAVALKEAPDFKVRPFSNATPEDLAALGDGLERERAWYRGVPRYPTNAHIDSAVTYGELFPVGNDADFRLIRRFFLNPEFHKAVLTARAIRARQAHGRLFREVLDDMGVVAPDVRISATSFTRSVAYQNTLVDEPGRLASAEEPLHPTGNAWDMDGKGYFEKRKNIWVSVSHPDRRPQNEEIIEDLLAQGVPKEGLPVYSYDYDPRITLAAETALQFMHDDGQVSLLVELPETVNTSLHVTVSPDY